MQLSHISTVPGTQVFVFKQLHIFVFEVIRAKPLRAGDGLSKGNALSKRGNARSVTVCKVLMSGLTLLSLCIISQVKSTKAAER